MKRKRPPPKAAGSEPARSGQPASAAPGSTASPPLSPTRQWLFRAGAILLVPLLVLGLLEAGLRLAGYGYSTRLFKPLRIGSKEFLVENDQFSFRFFPPELARTPGPIRMEPRKPPGTCRIFILGESAAMGDPEPGFGAGRYLEVLLRERYPNTRFEIINVAFTAINSHVIVPIARECAGQDGDLWIVYMGNNEMVGPFGAATVFGPKTPPWELVRLNLALQNTRLGQALAGVVRRLKGASKNPPSWGGMGMFLGNQVPPDARSKEAVYRSFRRNLRDILRAGRRAGAKVLLNTVAVNLKDCPPLATLSPTNLPPETRASFERLLVEGAALESRGDPAAAAQRLAEATGLFPLSAEAQYHWARCLLQTSNAPAAREHFARACDLDTLPFRTDSRINSIIREAAAARPDPGIVLFGAPAWLARRSAAGVPGAESFYEHVHLNFDGNYLLALGWAEQATRLLPASVTRAGATAWASQELCERRLGLTDWNRKIVAEGMIGRMRQAPLSGQVNNPQRIAALQSRVAELQKQMNAQGAARAVGIYQEALRLDPGDYCLHENYASFLVATGDLAGAAAQWRRVHELIPEDYLATFRLGELLSRQGQRAEAESTLSRAAALRPYLSDPWFELGQLRAAEGRFELALENFTRARQLRPGEPDYVFQMGRMLALLNRRPEAIEQFRLAIRLDPNHWQAHDALGGQLGLEGNIAEAKAEFERVVALQPSYGRAHLNLGVALLKLGQAAAAASAFQEAVRLEPTNAIARNYLGTAQAAAQPARSAP